MPIIEAKCYDISIESKTSCWCQFRSYNMYRSCLRFLLCWGNNLFHII